jgi:hypothetical protein
MNSLNDLASIIARNGWAASKSIKYKQLADDAKNEKIGMWSETPTKSPLIVPVEDLQTFVNSHKGQQLKCIVEYVMDASTFKLMTADIKTSDSERIFHTFVLSLSGNCV